MSNKQSFVFLNEVKPYKDNWRVHVKGGKLHSTAKRNQMYRAQRNFPIGEWRFIEKFTVSAAGGQYRTSRSQYKMTITGETVFSESDFSDDNPFLSLASYSILEDPKLKTVFLIDIIGEVFELGRIQTVQVHDKDKKRLQFQMRDTNGLDVVGCLWGKYAEQFEEYIERGNDQMLICLIRFAKINIFRGSIQITNGFDASIVTLNPTMQGGY
ncbi:hypothetical protein DY000_02022800 [Brassica cretica]|uniref:Replication protein A 70 kDa DNA-binding subunit B/D first OB fold domain-containing protein n=1 Tax=Brassica cretica TaxID=69181 RepID=A0ABQ7DZU0_BRACR|nr:hypothetical protein DY000_02022800 [Brassica cretica]